jgi:hypothetical protein
MMYLLETEWGGEGTAQSRVRDKHWCQWKQMAVHAVIVVLCGDIRLLCGDMRLLCGNTMMLYCHITVMFYDVTWCYMMLYGDMVMSYQGDLKKNVHY